jgi:hypothetical protein
MADVLSCSLGVLAPAAAPHFIPHEKNRKVLAFELALDNNLNENHYYLKSSDQGVFDD